MDLQPLGDLLLSLGLGELPSASTSLHASAPEHSAACAKPHAGWLAEGQVSEFKT
jgi:hypothetical protein